MPAGLAALALLVWFGPATPNVAWPGLFGIPTNPNVHGDMLLYADYAHRIDWGQDPYHDFPIEYPPFAIAMFLAPLPFGWEVLDYRNVFIAMMGILLAATAVCATLAVRRLEGGRAAELAAGGLVALAPLILGHDIAANRYDILVVFLVALAALLAVTGRFTWAAALLGLGLAAKFWPAVMLVPLAALAHRRDTVAGLWRVGAAFALAAATPFIVAAIWGSPGGLVDMFEVQTDRPLQMEAPTAAGLLALAEIGVGDGYGPIGSFGSLNLVGGAADSAPDVLGFLSLGAMICIFWLTVRRIRDAGSDRDAMEQAMLGTLTAVAGLIVLGKVGSPQFVLWLLPLPLLLPSQVRWRAAGLVVAALALTNIAFSKYPGYGVRFESGPIVLYLLRSVSLVLLLVICSMALARARPGRAAGSRSAAA